MLTDKKELSSSPIFYFLIGTSLLAYIAFRAFNMSLTHDESLSYSIVWGNTTYEQDANNHLLNTALMNFIVKKWHDDEWLLRLPNILSFIIYAFFSFKISQHLSNNFLRLSAFLLLLLNPFILDFFSLARGYGLSLAMMMGSIYYALKITDNHKSLKNNVLFAIFSILTVYANFTLLIFYLSIMTVWGMTWLLREKGRLTAYWLPLSIVAFHTYNLYYLLYFLFSLKKNGKLYAGGKYLVESIVESNIICWAYNDDSMLLKYIPLITGIVISLFFILIGNIVLKLLQEQKINIIPIVLGLCVLIPFLQNHILGILYPLERTATFYYVLWILGIVFLSFKNDILEGIYRTFLRGLTLLVMFNFFKTANLTHSHSWEYDKHTKEMMQTLKTLKENQTLSDTTQMSVFWLYYPASNVYYRPKFQYTWLKIEQYDAEKSSEADVLYLPEEEAHKLFLKKNYREIQHYLDTKTVLLVRK